MESPKSGSLAIVGVGMKAIVHCSLEALARIDTSDVLYSMSGGAVTEAWLRERNPSLKPLEHFYRTCANRPAAYRAMVCEVLGAVRAGKRVCVAFYGHPGVFVTPSHEMVRRARSEGFDAEMFPAISAEDSLFADLNVDPGIGMQSYEARDYFLHRRRIDPSAALILWQIAVMDDQTLRSLHSSARTLSLLKDALLETYPESHEVIVYEAATLVTSRPSIQRLPLGRLPEARINQVSTLFVAPLRAPEVAPDRLALLALGAVA